MFFEKKCAWWEKREGEVAQYPLLANFFLFAIVDYNEDSNSDLVIVIVFHITIRTLNYIFIKRYFSLVNFVYYDV